MGSNKSVLFFTKTNSGKAVGEVVNLLKFNQHFWMWPIARDIHRIQVDNKNNVKKVLSNKFYKYVKSDKIYIVVR